MNTAKWKKTTERTSSGLASGQKPYQVRARQAFPILVRQARANQPMRYEDMALELGMPNPRNLNYVLGTIGNALKDLSRQWNIQIPPIEYLVVNKKTGIPGEKTGFFLEDPETFKRSNLKQRRLIIQRTTTDISNFEQWDEVLGHFGLFPVDSTPIRIKTETGRYPVGGTGESNEHRMLKEYISRNPGIVELSNSSVTTHVEYEFPSADTIDVLFQQKSVWTGIEVKSRRSAPEDIVRGLFQCIKYRALIEATQVSESLSPNARVVLLLEDPFPSELLWLKHILSVEVVDQVSPK